MPQICDMGQTALLPFRKKACWGIFRPLRPGANPRSWVPEASMLTTRRPKPLRITLRRKWRPQHLGARYRMHECRGVRCRVLWRTVPRPAGTPVKCGFSVRGGAFFTSRRAETKFGEPVSRALRTTVGLVNVASAIPGLKFGHQNETRACWESAHSVLCVRRRE
jgi:hypothetical protein